ncbi:MAG: MFS transporter [Erysipelotrichales bacterium]
MKKAWLASLVAIFGGISLALVQNKISPIMPIIIEEFNVSMNTAGLLSSIFAVMGMVMAIPAAFILKKLGPKKAGLISLSFAILGSIIGVVSSNFTILVISRIVEGTGVGIIAVLAPALVSMWFPVEKRGVPMAVWGCWMMVSQVLLFLFAAPLTNKFGWVSMWYFGLISCLIAAVLFMFFVSAPPDESNYALENEQEDKVSIVEGLKNKSSWTLGLGATLFTFCSFSFVSWIGLYWSNATGWSLDKVSLFISLLYAVEIIYAIIVGFILNKTSNRKRLLVIAFILYALVGFTSFRIESQILVIAMVFIFPIFDGMVPSILWTIAPQTAKNPIFIGVSLGILNIGLNLGTLLSAPVSGWLVEMYGWSSIGFLFAGVALVGAFVAQRVKLYN